jgi:phosphohistidine phosphatase
VQLVLLRHAPAETRDPARWPDDTLRPLTPSGRRVAAEVGLGLRAQGVAPAQILTSPAKRCRDTARLVGRALGVSQPAEPWPELAFEAGAARFLGRLAERPGSGPWLIVGHEPSLGRLASTLVFGEPLSSIRLRRCGAAAIEGPRKPLAGSGQLEWVLTRRQLVQLARASG